MTHAETVLYASLIDVEALDELARAGLDPECIPTEGMRAVVGWALEYFHNSGRLKAPSLEMLQADWADRLEQCGVPLPDDTQQVDDVSWAIEDLRSQYVLSESQRLQREIAIDIASADVGDRVAAVARGAESWFGLALTVRDRRNESEAYQGIQDSLARYRERAAAQRQITGMCLGIDAIDQHILGIQDGEAAVWAAGPKGGKSWTLSWAAISEWRRGRETVLFTLENTVKMTEDRIACQLCAVDYRAYQKGEASAADIERIEDFLANEGVDMKDGLHILSPEPGRRTASALVRQAQSLGAKGIIIDQLSHVEHPAPARKSGPEKIRDIMMGFTSLITTGRQQMPLLLAHQFNREGVKNAKAHGTIEPEHLAEGSEVERSASHVFGLLRSETEQRIGRATAHLIACRRMDRKEWPMAFEPWYGIQQAREEVGR